MKIGDIVQIIDGNHDYYCCLAVVSEIREQYITAYIAVPSRTKKGCFASLDVILELIQIEKVGKAVMFYSKEESIHG